MYKKISKLMILLIFSISVFQVSSIPVYSQSSNMESVQETRSEIEDEAEISNDESLNDIPTEMGVRDDTGIETEGENLFVTVKQGGPIMIFLIIIGLISLTIIIERIIYFHKNKLWNNNQIDIFIKEIVDKSDSKYREDMEDELRGYFNLFSTGMERGLALLSGIGNLSPIIGFLGTVIGMISAFAAIAAATTVNAKVVAVGIQIALVTTAGGLTVAAPTLTFYYLFEHLIQNRYARSEEIISTYCENLPRLSEQIAGEKDING